MDLETVIYRPINMCRSTFTQFYGKFSVCSASDILVPFPAP